MSKIEEFNTPEVNTPVVGDIRENPETGNAERYVDGSWRLMVYSRSINEVYEKLIEIEKKIDNITEYIDGSKI